MKIGWALCGAVLTLGAGCDESEPDGAHDPEQVVDAGKDAGAADAEAQDGGSPTKATRSALFPLGFAVSSPTAMARKSFDKGVDPASADTHDERAEQLEALLAGRTLGDCGVMLGALLGGQGDNVSCYGPELDYQNHPDAMGGSASGRLPGGDLGLWKPTEPDGQACAAAKLNALIDTLSRRVDFGLYVAASMVCTGRVSREIRTDEADGGVALDGTLDLTNALSTALAMNQNLTVERASLERVRDAGSPHTYHYALSIVGPMGRAVTTDIEHVAEAAGAGSYAGRIWGTVSEGTRTDAYSVGYQRSEGTGRLRYHVVTASFDATPVDPFDATGHFRLASNWSGNIAQGIFDMDAARVATGHASFAWQAGANDSHARVFNVFTETSGTTVAGCGFFGYGPRFDRGASSLPTNAISTFICNWAGPSNDHGGLAGYAQKQCMTQGSVGFFEPTSSAIAYAPVNACSTAGGFGYKLPSEASYVTTPLTSALVKLSTDADYARYQAPSILP